MKRKSYVLLAILLLASLVRVYGSWTFPFEQDELYTVDEATNLFHTALLPGIQARPFFFLIEHPIMVWLPHTPMVLRALPLIIGILGVVAVWALARKVLGEWGALLAALLAALSPWHLEAFGFGRYYSLLFLLATLVYWLLPAAYDSDRPRTYLATCAALLIGAWTHPSFVFPVGAAALAVMLVRPDGQLGWRWPTANGWRYLWLPFFALSAGIYAVIRMIHHASTVANGEDRGLLATLRLIPAMVDWITPIVFIAATIGAIVLLRSTVRAQRLFGAMALLGVLGMVLALFALSFVTAIYADYGISALPLVFVAAAGLVQWIVEAMTPIRQRVAAGAIAGILVVGTLPSTLSHLSDGTRFDYRPAYARIAAEAPQTAVLTWPLALQREYAPSLRAYELPTTVSKFDTVLTRERDAWAVISVKRYGIVGDGDGAIAAWLRARCRSVSDYQRPRLDYRLYRVELWRCTAPSPSL